MALTESTNIGQAQHLIGALIAHGILQKNLPEEQCLNLWDVVGTHVKVICGEAEREATAPLLARIAELEGRAELAEQAYVSAAEERDHLRPLLARIAKLEACLLQSQNAAIDLAKQAEQAAQPVAKGTKHEKEPGTWHVDSRPSENGGTDSIGACTESRNGENQRDEHRAGYASAERENDQRDCRGDGLRGSCDVSSPEPYGQVTTHCMTGQQFFYRWPQLPYLDNASECVTVYTAPPKAAPQIHEPQQVEQAAQPVL